MMDTAVSRDQIAAAIVADRILSRLIGNSDMLTAMRDVLYLAETGALLLVLSEYASADNLRNLLKIVQSTPNVAAVGTFSHRLPSGLIVPIIKIITQP